jgi:hypothetical protein
MKTLLITLIFILSMLVGCGDDSSGDKNTGGETTEGGGTGGGGTGGGGTGGGGTGGGGTGVETTKGDFSNLEAAPVTENMKNDNKSFSSARGR